MSASNSNELQTAHEYYLAALANRERDPTTYEGARIRYMSLREGPGWLQREKERVNDNKLQPTVDNYRRQFNALSSQASAQRGLVESISSVRDGQADLIGRTSDQFQYLDALLAEKEAKMSVYDRFVELTTPAAYAAQSNTGQGPESVPFLTYFASFPPSFNTVLNVIIGITGLLLLLTIISKTRNMFAGWSNFYTRASMAMTPQTPIVINTPASR
jgi:hypothetical protein